MLLSDAVRILAPAPPAPIRDMLSGFADHTADTFAALLPNVQFNMALEAIEEEYGGDPQYIKHVLTTLTTNGTWPDLFALTTFWLKHGMEAVW